MTDQISKSADVQRFTITKSPEDDRHYRGLVLTNGLKALLVSDPTSDKAAASMDVNVGSMSDPTNLPGLAHFLEHMLFLGTEKYPDENEYTKFLSQHSGWSNAYTACDHTNYYFDISPKFLPGALDRFAQFFLHPLFTESATDREVQAVNSEHEKNIPSDTWRLSQIDHALSDPNHDFFKFATGNIETLQDRPKAAGIDVRAELLAFHRKWYSANIMALCVIGNQTLDELEEMVVDLFSGVENKNVVVPEYQDHPYKPEKSKSITYIVPVKDLRIINIAFPITDLHPYYKTSPGQYLAHLIGHEGPGSLLSELKSLGWANSLVSGERGGAKGFGFFTCNLELTVEGLEHVDDVVYLLFQYLEMLKTQDCIQEWIFDECKNMSAMQFRFRDKEKPFDMASRLSGRIHDYPMEEVLTGSYILSDWKADLIKMVLDKLVPDNVWICAVSQTFADIAVETEPWYGTKYVTQAIPEEKLQRWSNPAPHERLRLPERNEFIPTDFELVPRDESGLTENEPRIIHETPLVRIWFKQDNEFKRPKACMNFMFKSPLTYLDPHLANVAYLWTQLIKDDLNEYAYAASLAGLHYSLVNAKTGFRLAISGYHQKQAALLEKILNHIVNFRPRQDRFDVLRAEYERGLKNFRMEQPHKHAVFYNQMHLSTQFWNKEESLAVFDYLVFDAVKDFVDQLLSFGIFVEGVVHGNMTPTDATNVMNIIEKSFGRARRLHPGQLTRDREVQLPAGENIYNEVTTDVHKSSCIEVSLQCGLEETRSNVLLELYEQLIHESCFDVLRTKEQLGYIVFSGISRPRSVQSFRVIVQSNRKPDYLDERIERFLLSTRQLIADMSEEEFQKNKTALADRYLEKPKKLSARSAKFWSEITSQQYNFYRDEVEATELTTVTKDDILNFYDRFISANSPERRKIACHVVSTADTTNENGQQANGLISTPEQETADEQQLILPPRVLVSDANAFKSFLPLWPLAKPYKQLQEFMYLEPKAEP